MLLPLDLITSIYVIAFIFFFVALVYSSIGMGGGSSYTAIMALLSINILAIPIVSLVLNLMVTSVGSFNFIRNNHARFKLVLPFLLTSIPAAYLGGSLNLPAVYFHWILFVSLVFVAARIYLWENVSFNLSLTNYQKTIISLVSGFLLGLIAGIVGIGGGIYLVPLIIILGLGSEKEAAACGAIFIWLNSASGLSSRMQFNQIEIFDFWPLLVAVVIGGTIGSYMGSFRISGRSIDRLLGLVVLVAIGFLGKKLLF